MSIIRGKYRGIPGETLIAGGSRAEIDSAVFQPARGRSRTFLLAGSPGSGPAQLGRTNRWPHHSLRLYQLVLDGVRTPTVSTALSEWRGRSGGNDFQVSITAGFLKIAEGGFTRTFNVLGNDEQAPLFANGFNAAHIKFRVMPENAWHRSFVPALAAGAIVRTQVRRVTEVTERENTTATDFFLVGTKTIANTRVPIVLNLGVKLTNASIFGIAANSPGWEVKPFGGLFVAFKAPLHSRLTLGAEFARQPRQLKEVPGTVVPTTLSYLVRWRPGSDVPLTLEFGLVQLGNNLGAGFDMEARHQIVLGATYHF
jgi:hypothetical protein